MKSILDFPLSFTFTFCTNNKTLHGETIRGLLLAGFAARITNLAQQTDQKQFSAIFRSLWCQNMNVATQRFLQGTNGLLTLERLRRRQSRCQVKKIISTLCYCPHLHTLYNKKTKKPNTDSNIDHIFYRMIQTCFQASSNKNSMLADHEWLALLICLYGNC